MAFIDVHNERVSNPVDTIETVAALRDWTFERAADDEITISVSGMWTEYQISVSWMDHVEALHLACAFDLSVPDARTTEVMRLMALVNEQMWCGHFDLWGAEGVVMYRQSLLLSGGVEPTSKQVESMLANALEASERYYQAFQFVVWAGQSAREALACTLFETAGEA